MVESLSMMITFVPYFRVGGDALPRVRLRNIVVRYRVAAPCAKCRSGHLGLSCAAPAIIGTRVPEAYVAIMELKGHLRI